MALLSSPLNLISSLPPVTRTLGGLVLLLSLAYQYLRYAGQTQLASYLTLIPGAWIWSPWTIVTSSVVETNIIELVFSLVFVLPALRYLERLWGTVETVKFIVVTCGVSNVLCIIVNYAEWFVLGSEFFLYGMTYHGLMALQAACLVGFTQVIPEHQVQLFGVITMRVKQLPMLYVGFSNVMCIIGFQSPYILIQWGWLVGWTYLRFYKRTGATSDLTVSGTSVETWGDRSETFAFIYWFPPFVHAPLGKVTDIVYNVAVKVKLVKPYPASDLESGGYAPLGGGNARAEAERRRAMALKALDQRMANAAAANTNNAQNVNTGTAGPSTSTGPPPATNTSGSKSTEVEASSSS